MSRSRLEWTERRNRLSRVQSEADEIAKRLSVTLPVDPLRVAASEGDRLRCDGGDFRKQFDGQLEYHRRHGCFLLFYNTRYDVTMPPGVHHPRTRFSVAHELAHYFLEDHHAYLRRGGRPHPSKGEFVADAATEWEADTFAATLLMPSSLVRSLVNEGDLDLPLVENVARQCQTSLVSASLRCVELSDSFCAVVGLRDGLVAWSVCSQALLEAGFYPPAKLARPSSAAQARCTAFADGGHVGEEGSAVTGEWFRTFVQDGRSSLHVDERYLPVPVMDTLLVLLSVPEDELCVEDDDDEGDE